MRAGWLTFESPHARKRLVPIPPAWEDASVDELRQHCQRAQTVSRTPITGTWRIEERE